MEDDIYAEYNQPPEKKRPSIWVWVLIGFGVVALCCMAIIAVFIALPGDEIQNVFEELEATLNAADTSDSTISENPVAVAPVDTTASSYEPYRASFNAADNWAIGTATAEDDPDVVEAEVQLDDGRLNFHVAVTEGLYWTTADIEAGNGVYEVTAEAVEGTLNNGFGLLLMVDNQTDDFYLFEISSDGYVWIGYYADAGYGAVEPLVGESWFESAAINQGLGVKNHLRAEANNGNLRFLVNEIEVARVRDFTLLEGDSGVFVETLGEGNVRVLFDNFSYTPENE